MEILLWLICLNVLKTVFGICDSTSSEVCKLYNNQDLPYQYTRHPSINYSSSTDDTKYCDLHALQHGTWYRSSYNLITECVDHRKCGTSDPIWLNGTLPVDTEGAVERTGCVRTFDSCCEHSLSFKMRNCTYYMVYCFVDLHPSCHSRYCLDIDLSIETTTTTTTMTTTTTVASAASGTKDTEGTTTKDDDTDYIVAVSTLAFGFTAITLITVYLLYKRHQLASSKVDSSRMSFAPDLKKVMTQQFALQTKPEARSDNKETELFSTPSLPNATCLENDTVGHETHYSLNWKC